MRKLFSKINTFYYYIINNINLLAGFYVILCLFITYNLAVLNPYNIVILFIYGLFIELFFKYITLFYQKVKIFLKK